MIEYKLYPIKQDFEIVRGYAIDFTFEVFDKDENCVKVPRNLELAIITLSAWDSSSYQVLNSQATVSGVDFNIVTFNLSESDTNLYPTVYEYKMLSDDDLILQGSLTIKNDANYKVTYPKIIATT